MADWKNEEIVPFPYKHIQDMEHHATAYATDAKGFKVLEK